MKKKQMFMFTNYSRAHSQSWLVETSQLRETMNKVSEWKKENLDGLILTIKEVTVIQDGEYIYLDTETLRSHNAGELIEFESFEHLPCRV